MKEVVNNKKTFFMKNGDSIDKITAEPFRANFEISSEPIEQNPSVKYLGFTSTISLNGKTIQKQLHRK